MSLPTITPAEAKRRIAQGAALIDIREKDEYAREHIAGARNRPLAALATLNGVKGPIIFHYRAGSRTSANASRLQQAAECEAKAALKDGNKPAFLSRSTRASRSRSTVR